MTLLQRCPSRWDGQPAHICVFQCQQPHFPVNAAGITSQASVGADHPMTGHDDRNGVMSHGTAHSLCGYARNVPLCSKPPGDLPIGHRLSIWNGAQDSPHIVLERRAGKMQRYVEFRFAAGEVHVQPSSRRLEHGSISFLMVMIQQTGEVLLPFKP